MTSNYRGVFIIIVASVLGCHAFHTNRHVREVNIITKTTANEDHKIKRDNITELTIAGDPTEIEAIFSFLAASANNHKSAHSGKWRVKQNPKSYDVVTIEMTFMEAIVYCKERRGNLATISSQDDMNQIIVPAKFVAGSVSPPWYYWIGGTNYGSSGSFYWFSDGQKFSYNNWTVGYPTSDQGAKCLQLYYGKEKWGWINHDCSRKRYPIYEYGSNTDNTVLAQGSGVVGGIGRKPKSFEVIEIEMSWMDSIAYCKERRGDLATIRSQDDADRIAVPAKIVANNSGAPWYYWIGGTKLGSSRGFYWFSDGQSFNFYNWYDGYPTNDASADCMQLYHYKKKWGWINLPCAGRRYPICEYGANLVLDVDG